MTPAQRIILSGGPSTPWQIPGLRLALEARAGMFSAIGPDTAAGYGAGVRRWADLSGLGNHADQATGGSQPKAFPWTSAEGNYYHSSGVANNYLSSNANFAGSAAWDLRWKVTPSSFADDSQLINKQISGLEFLLGFPDATVPGRIRLAVNTDGTSGGRVNFTSTVSRPNWTVGVPWCGRVTFTENDGAGQSVATFYTSNDEGQTWIQLGAQVTAATASYFKSGTQFFIAKGGASFGYFVGKVHWVEIRNGIGGTLVASFDASRGNANSSTITDALGNVWTINRSGANPAGIVSFPFVRFDGVDDFLGLISGMGMFRNVPGATMLAAVRMPTVAGVNTPIFYATLGSVSTSARAGLFGQSTSTMGVGGRRLDTDSFQALTGSATATSFGVLAGRLDYANAAAHAYRDGAQIAATSSFQTAGNTTDTDSLAITLGSNNGTGFGNVDLAGLYVFNRALSDRERRVCERSLAAIANGAVTLA